MDINSGRLWNNIEELGKLGCQEDGSIIRLPFTREDRLAQDFLMDRMRDAGLAVRIDSAGNLIGERIGTKPCLPPVLTGSHYDSVINGGRFDGCLGILAAIEALQTMEEKNIRTARTIRLYCFKDEEGNRFGYGMIGSRSVCGIADPKGLDSMDESGITLREAMKSFGLQPDRLSECKTEQPEAFLELHIEQGRVLEDNGKQAGVVLGIAGLVRYQIRIDGVSGHAGATPMKARRDPVTAASHYILKITELAEERDNCVATVGSIKTFPGACNVICSHVEFSLDLRSCRQETIDEVVALMEEHEKELEASYGIHIQKTKEQELPPCPCSEKLMDTIESSCEAEGISHMKIMSGAGHDCMNFRDVCPTGMIFVPSKEGMSHRKEEYTSPEDCAAGAQILYRTLLLTGGENGRITKVF